MQRIRREKPRRGRPRKARPALLEKARETPVPEVQQVQFSKRIEWARKRFNLNQAEFAELIGTNLASVKRWERGRSANLPNGESLRAIAHRTEVDLNWLLGFGALDDPRLRGTDASPPALFDLLAQHVRAEFRHRIRNGEFEDAGPIKPRFDEKLDEEWPVDGEVLFTRMIDREAEGVRAWLRGETSEMMIRVLAADIRRSLEAIADHRRSAGRRRQTSLPWLCTRWRD